MTDFDKRKTFEKEIEPLLEEAVKKCGLHSIPMFYSACVANNESKSTYVRNGICTGSKEIELKDDQITKHLCIANGFDIKTSNATDLTDEQLDYLDIDLDDV